MTEHGLDNLTPFSAPSARMDFASWFDSAHNFASRSPIDEFLENVHAINQLYLQAEDRNEYKTMLGSLVFLGLMSAAEGYFRSLLRRLILVDEVCKANASPRSVTYGAAIHHSSELLPEALLEAISFASSKAVKKELNDLCGISIPAELESLLDVFDKICQIRHCGIHRFGKLGSQQAFQLDIDNSLLEKPLKLSVAQLQDIAEALEAVVRGVNSHAFADVVKRSHRNSPAGRERKLKYARSWELNFDADRDRFVQYYSIFASTLGSNRSQSIESVYQSFMEFVRRYDRVP